MTNTEWLPDQHLAELRQALNCPILAKDDAEYGSARRVWNGMIDRRPAAIVRAASISDVMQSVRFARERGLAATVRGGGHSVAGKAVFDGALMIDLSSMSGVHVDGRANSVVAQGGATYTNFDRECEIYGMATTGGVISSTGVCGLTLGGGLGWLMGKHGLSCDNVISADIVTAEGKHLTATESRNEDLFWAIRGGGGNFGIVTALEFRLYPLEGVHGGILLYPRASALDLLRKYRDITAKAPDELTAYAALLVGHGNPMAAIALCHSGSPSERAGAALQFQLQSPPALDLTGEKNYTEIQTMLDHSAPAGVNYYFKCPFLRELSDEALRAIVEYAESFPTEQTQVIIEHMHGAASRVPADHTAFGLRRDHYSINIVASWSESAMTGQCVAWAGGLAKILESFGASDGYVNYLGEEGSAAVKASYGPNYERLAQVKKRYDPDNFFRFNQNIMPAS